jgi:3-polyprenyl-4-hydroxybenzoate decarboxylase
MYVGKCEEDYETLSDHVSVSEEITMIKSKMKLHTSDSLSFHRVIQTDYAVVSNFVANHSR